MFRILAPIVPCCLLFLLLASVENRPLTILLCQLILPIFLTVLQLSILLVDDRRHL